MRTRRMAFATVAAAFVAAAVVGAGVAAAPAPTQDALSRVASPTGLAAAPRASAAPDDDATPEPPIITLQGVLSEVVAADGDRDYHIVDVTPGQMLGQVWLSVGPPWHWGANHPLAGLVGQTIIVTGRMDDGRGRTDKAKDKTKDKVKAQDAAGPELDVYTVNGATIRAPGKPPWAGGPPKAKPPKVK
jgi:hypothetical protein